MSEDIKKTLIQAKKLYQNKKYKESKDLYESIYEDNQEAFDIWDKRFYCWALYQTYIKNPADKTELIEAVDLITQLLPQENLSKKEGVCGYTLSMMKLLDYLYRNNDYEEIIVWADRLNPDYLSSKNSTFTNDDGKVIHNPSFREKYYSLLSKSYLEEEDYDECLTISKEALERLDEFTNNSDIWFKWRIAKSLREIGEYNEAIEYLKDIYKYKKDWFIQGELAENYFFKGDNEKSLEYAVSAALNHGDIDKKIKLYSLLEDLLQEEYPDIALKHAYLIYSIRLHNKWSIDESLEDKIADSDFDSENTEYWKIEKDLHSFWNELKYKNQNQHSGYINKILPHGKSGFIRTDNGDSYFFNKFQFKGDDEDFKEGVNVLFYLEEGYDKSKDEFKLNAVNIHTI